MFTVVISCRKRYFCYTEEEAWEQLGKRGIGDTYMVYNFDGSIAEQFVPY